MSSVSNEIRARLNDSGSLLQALDAISHRPAFLTLAATIVVFGIAFAVLSGLSALAGMKVAAWLGALLGLVSALVGMGILLVGGNAVGIMLMDEAKGGQSRPVKDALLVSLFTSHRVVVVALVEGLLFLAYLLLVGLVLLVCKIPGLGPLLYAFVFPVAVLATGLVLFALFYVALPMALPAIWSGNGILATVGILGAIARQRLMYVVVMQVLLGLLVLFLAGLIGGVLAGGTTVTLGFSALILGAGGDLGGIMAMLMGSVGGMNGMGGGMGEGAGYAWALGVGFAILFLCGAVPPALVAMRGLCAIYNSATDGLALGDAEAKLREKLGDLKAKAEQAREAAMAKANEAMAKTNVPPAPPAAPAAATPAAEPAAKPAAGPFCPGCGEPVAADDLFCGACGRKMK